MNVSLVLCEIREIVTTYDPRKNVRGESERSENRRNERVDVGVGEKSVSENPESSCSSAKIS